MASFSYFPFTNPLIEPHWFYFSSMGFFILLANLILIIKERVRLAIWLSLMAFLILINISLLKSNYEFWRDEESYCRYWLSINDHELTAYHGLGRALVKKGKTKEAIFYLEKGKDVVTYKNAQHYATLGYAYYLDDNADLALKHLLVAKDLEPKSSTIYYYLGLLYGKKGNEEKAREFFKKAAELYPENTTYQYSFKSK